jgi:hypothetical protein
VALKDEGFSFLDISPGVVNTAEVPPTEEAMKEIKDMVTRFKAIHPHWTGDPITAAESVGLMIGIIDNLAVKDTGKFVSHKVRSLHLGRIVLRPYLIISEQPRIFVILVIRDVSDVAMYST